MRKSQETAILEFLNQFPTLTGTPPNSLTDLSDGVALFEALAEISLDHFDPTTIARDIDENWALKLTNLRKLIKNLEVYYNEDLAKSYDFDSIDISGIARSGENNEKHIATLFGLVAAAAVQCEDRGVFVQRIMGMGADSQMEMKDLIEGTLTKLKDVDNDDDDDDDNNVQMGDGVENEIEFNGASSSFDNNNIMRAQSSVDDDAEELMEARAEIDRLKSELWNNSHNVAESSTEEAEAKAANQKLRFFAEDLQERLQDREGELMDMEQGARMTKRNLEEITVEVEQLREKNRLLEDEMSVAQSQVSQLRKAEASVLTYRKKLESVGVMNMQMQELEDQSATYLRQIVDLENSVKTIPSLQKKIADLTEQVGKYEREVDDSSSGVKLKDAEIVKLRSQLTASGNAKKMLEEELETVHAEQEVAKSAADDDFGGMGGLSFSTRDVSELKEKAIRLEHENKSLKDQLVATTSAADGSDGQGGGSDGSTTGSASEVLALKAQIAHLQVDIKERESMANKLTTDKEKLEAYTKKTLHKFQEKYLVALQECKAKLKDKHDKIEALEARQSAERSAQKREERLLSSTIYELGLSIMQHRLTKK